MSLLIAEIGNCHLGNFKLAKELIRVANNSGADLIKGQAFLAADIKSGSMEKAFYERCAFNEDQYIELIDYARSIGTDMFYSVFSHGFDRLKKYQKWSKVAASQTVARMYDPSMDTDSIIVSVPRAMIERKEIPKIKHGWLLYATEYMTKNPRLDNLYVLGNESKAQIGLSDHTLGVSACLSAIRWYGVKCIEKHFTLQKEMTWRGVVFRDTVHGATARELETIASAMQKG